jgi:hypothetical protein
MEVYYIINYYIKYVELIDTVFLALKKKPLGELSRCLYTSFLLLLGRPPFSVGPNYHFPTPSSCPHVLLGNAHRFGLLRFLFTDHWFIRSFTAFLHVFHHAATACLCFNQLNGKTPVVSIIHSCLFSCVVS